MTIFEGYDNAMKEVASSEPAPARAVVAARLAAFGVALVAATILALHWIKPEFAPSWRFISEYAIGQHGWIMKLTFVIWAASCAALAVALKGEARTRPAKIGIAVLFLVAIAQVFAGLFPQDPVTARPDELTTTGNVHAAVTMVGIPGIPIAAMLISSSLWRTNARWRSHRAVIMAAAHATWISLVLMIAYLMWAVPRAGGFNSGVAAGWMNRLVVAAYLVWHFVVARRVALNGTSSQH